MRQVLELRDADTDLPRKTIIVRGRGFGVTVSADVLLSDGGPMNIIRIVADTSIGDGAHPRQRYAVVLPERPGVTLGDCAGIISKALDLCSEQR